MKLQQIQQQLHEKMKIILMYIVVLACFTGTSTPIQAQPTENPGMMLLRLVKRADYFVTAGGGMYVFPNGIKQPIFGIDIPASTLGPLMDASWGITGWLGKVMITESLGIKMWQVNIPSDPAAQIQTKSNNVSLGVGYTVIDDPIFRLTPLLSFGFVGIKLIDSPVNSYLTLGGEVDASVILPLLPTVDRGNTFAVVASLLSLRLGYLQNFSAFTAASVQNEIVARITIGFGLHTNYEAELPFIEPNGLQFPRN